jgi:endonuclease-8
MPEGDSLHKLAAKLRPLLVGRTVRAFEAHPIDDRIAATLLGRTITIVEARGKNLLVSFDDGRMLHVHLRMLGRVRVERPRSTFYRARTTTPQLRLEVEGATVVGSRIPVLRLLAPGAERRAPDLASLGPDLLGATLDEDEVVRRLRALGRRPVGEALLVQRAAAGIGNVYKSELLFLEGIHPEAATEDLGDDRLRQLVRRARDLLQRNLGDGPRVTRPSLAGPRVWVYGRRGKACLRCQAPIEMIRQGAAPGRSTYFCPRCQRLS